jgi:5-methylcytosine-specific restriction enzyme A
MWWFKKKKKERNPYSLRDKHQHYYQSLTHKRWRALVLANYPLCVQCELEGRLEPATVADHIQSVTTHWHLRASVDNGQGLCDRCHNIKSNQERNEYRLYGQQQEITDKMNQLNNFET